MTTFKVPNQLKELGFKCHSSSGDRSHPLQGGNVHCKDIHAALIAMGFIKVKAKKVNLYTPYHYNHPDGRKASFSLFKNEKYTWQMAIS